MKKLHLLFVMFLFFTSVQAQITANFLAQSYNPCTANNAPVTVDFLDLSISSTGAVDSWLWDFGDGSTSVAISPSYTYTTPGSYTICLTVGNLNGQTDTECKTDYISFANTPVCIIEPPTNLSCLNTSVTLDGTMSTIGPNTTYEWTSVTSQIIGTDLTLTVFSPGQYTLTATDTIFGCSSQTTVVVGVDADVPIAVSGANAILTCASPSVILSGMGSSTGPNFEYSWTDDNGTVVGTDLTIEVFQAGAYTIKVTDTSNGCVSQSTTLVQEDNFPPTANAGADLTLDCSIGSVTLDGSGSSIGANFSYEWVDGNGAVIGTSLIENVSQAGSYILTVTDALNGCTDTDTVQVFPSPLAPLADAGPDQELTCNNSSVILDASGSSTGADITYVWSGAGINVSNINVLNPEVSVPDIYVLVVTDITNGCTAIDSVLVIENNSPPLLSNLNFIPDCSAGTVTVMCDVSCSFTVSDTLGNPFCQNTSQCMVATQDGPFIIEIQDLNSGCTASDTFALSVSSPIEITSANITNVSCYGEFDGAIDITIASGTPAYTYGWSTAASSEDISGLSAGIYNVTVADANGCTLIENFIVEEPTELVISSVIITNPCNNNDGAIDILADGGTPPYLYTWSNGMNIPNPSGLNSGVFSVTVTDANSCTITSDFTLQGASIINLIIGDTTICQGDMASLNVFAPGAVSYQWSPTLDLNDPTIANPIAAPTGPTTYSVVVTDATGCTETGSVFVNVQSYLDFGLLQFSNAPICEDDTLEFYANLGIQFNWTGPNGFSSNSENPIIPNASANNSGIYSLEITDFFGCSATADVDVFIDDDCVYPGDTDTNMVVNHFDLLNIGLAFDSMGTPRQNASLNWIGQPALDWSQSTPSSNVNFKHIDTDGNGVINSSDTFAITQNFGLTHNFNDPNVLNQFIDLPNSADGVLTIPFYVEPDTLLEGETVNLDIILGDVSNVVMGLYGIGFSLEYDSSIVVSGSAKIDFSNTWLGSLNADAISVQFDFPSPGRIDAAITRIDGMEMDGFGVFGNFIITLEDDILLWDPSSQWAENPNTVSTEFSITNYHLINFSQEEIPVNGITTTSTIDETTSLNQVELDALIEVYPNPANELFFIASQNLEMEKIRIYSATGELKTEAMKANNQMEFSTKDFSNGIYFVEIQTREGIVIKKLSIVK